MIWEALGAVIVGFIIALSAMRWLSDRFPARTLTLATGPAAALFGALLTRSILGPGYPAQVLVAAIAMSAALLSVLLRPGRRGSPALKSHRTA